MGSAFPADWLGGPETVLFLTFPNDENADLVCHLKHAECPQEMPHRMHECGRFDPPPPPQEPT